MVIVEVIHAYADIKLMAQLQEIGKYGAWTDRRGRSKRIREGRRITVPFSLFNSCCSHFLLPDLCQLMPKYSPAEVKRKKMAGKLGKGSK